MTAGQVTRGDPRERIAPINFVAGIEFVSSAIRRKSILHNSERSFPGPNPAYREFTGQVRGKRQWSAAGKILKIGKHDPLRWIENAHAAGSDELGRVFFAPKSDPDSARPGIDDDMRSAPPQPNRARCVCELSLQLPPAKPI